MAERAGMASMCIPGTPRMGEERRIGISMKGTTDRLRTYLSQRLGTDSLHDDDDIFASGLVNSLFAMELVLFVEAEFSIKIENEDLHMDSFRTISALADLIERKTASPS